jgi:hypothetical protein
VNYFEKKKSEAGLPDFSTVKHTETGKNVPMTSNITN